MIKTGKCVAGIYWAITINENAKHILKRAYDINSNTSQIVQVYNSAHDDLDKIAFSQKIQNLPKCNILVIAPEAFGEEVTTAIGVK